MAARGQRRPRRLIILSKPARERPSCRADHPALQVFGGGGEGLRGEWGRGGVSRIAGAGKGEIRGGDAARAIRSQRHGGGEHGLQLPHIAGPVLRREPGQRAGGDLARALPRAGQEKRRRAWRKPQGRRLPVRASLSIIPKSMHPRRRVWPSRFWEKMMRNQSVLK